MNKPKLYLGPWRPTNDDNTHYLIPILGENRAYDVMYFIGRQGARSFWYHMNSMGQTFPHKEDAMKDVERHISENYDAIFLTQEQFDRLSLLV